MDTINYIEPIGSSQEQVLDYLKTKPKGITFIHGKAGCGKTYTIKKDCRYGSWLSSADTYKPCCHII